MFIQTKVIKDFYSNRYIINPVWWEHYLYPMDPNY